MKLLFTIPPQKSNKRQKIYKLRALETNAGVSEQRKYAKRSEGKISNITNDEEKPAYTESDQLCSEKVVLEKKDVPEKNPLQTNRKIQKMPTIERDKIIRSRW